MGNRSNPEQSGVFERVEAGRASLRARLAARPTDPWIERERFSLEAAAEITPAATMPTAKRGRGRPRKNVA